MHRPSAGAVPVTQVHRGAARRTRRYSVRNDHDFFRSPSALSRHIWSPLKMPPPPTIYFRLGQKYVVPRPGKGKGTRGGGGGAYNIRSGGTIIYFGGPNISLQASGGTIYFSNIRSGGQYISGDQIFRQSRSQKYLSQHSTM